ncbi:hypothetical protein MKL26_07070 [Streptococcus suis]|nr:hypothetical protein [Streptococcus suis]
MRTVLSKIEFNKLIHIKNIVTYIYSFILVLVLGILSLVLSINDTSKIVAVLWLFIFIITVRGYLNEQFENTINDFLIEKLDIDAYDYCIVKEIHLPIIGNRKYFNTRKKILLAYTQMLRGNFQLSLQQLEKLEPNCFSKKKYSILKQQAFYLILINKILLEDPKVFNTTLLSTEIGNNYKEKLQAIYDIFILSKPNNYFDETIGKNKLENIEIKYYKALNTKLRNDINYIKTFEEVAKKDSKLFYVSFAKKQLIAVERD